MTATSIAAPVSDATLPRDCGQHGISPAEAAAILFPQPSFEKSADAPELVRQLKRAVSDYLDDATIAWLAEETMYQAALLASKEGRPLDLGYIGTVSFVRGEELSA